MMEFLLAALSAARIRRPGSAICGVVRTRKTISVVACLGALFLGGLSLQARSAGLYQEVAADDQLALFSNAVERAGLSESLEEAGPFTLFVPSDQAMINEGSAFLLERVLLTKSNAEHLADLVLHHIVPARRLTPDQLDSVELPTLAGVSLRVSRVGSGMVVGGWAVVTDRKVADNGVIYIIDRLLWPRDWQSHREFAP